MEIQSSLDNDQQLQQDFPYPNRNLSKEKNLTMKIKKNSNKENDL
jgi:hypothetical protein